MHILGKVLLGLIAVLLIPAAIILTTMSLDVRSKWQAAVEQRQEKLATTAAQLTEARVKVSELEGALQRETFDWGDVWAAPQSQPLSAGNDIQLGVGRSSGLGRNVSPGKTPRVYVFSENGEQSRYIGEFELVQIDADRSVAQLIRQPFPGEFQSWPRGMYHVRDTLPPNWLSTVADIEAQITVGRSKYSMQQEQDRILTGQLQASTETLEQRLAELNGDTDAPPGASQQVVDGLVETLRKLENERNSVLSEVHDLRKKLVHDYLNLESILAKNRESVDKRQVNVPAPKPAVAAQ